MAGIVSAVLTPKNVPTNMPTAIGLTKYHSIAAFLWWVLIAPKDVNIILVRDVAMAI